MRLVSHFNFFHSFRNPRGEEQHILASPDHLQFKSSKKPNHHARVLEVFVGTYNAKRKKVTQNTKNEKTLLSKYSANDTNNTPITNRCTCKYHTQNLSPFLFADSWRRTCLEVANFLRGQRVIYQWFRTNCNPNQAQIIITKSMMRHTQKKPLKYS